MPLSFEFHSEICHEVHSELCHEVYSELCHKLFHFRAFSLLVVCLRIPLKLRWVLLSIRLQIWAAISWLVLLYFQWRRDRRQLILQVVFAPRLLTTRNPPCRSSSQWNRQRGAGTSLTTRRLDGSSIARLRMLHTSQGIWWDGGTQCRLDLLWRKELGFRLITINQTNKLRCLLEVCFSVERSKRCASPWCIRRLGFSRKMDGKICVK